MLTIVRLLRAKLFAVAALACMAFSTVSVHAQAYVGKPKLIVIVVIDQFRGDYLNRHQADFKGKGFNLFLKQGAWFTDCYYNYANTKTAPGHSTIGTGAYSDGHGIDSNEWWDASRSYEAEVSSVQDERYQLVDIPHDSIPANQPGAAPWATSWVIGASPLNLRASTLGDELRLATQGKAHVYGVSLKDRAAILPVGQAANGAFWIDPISGQFTTSTYYMQHLPDWATKFNASDEIAKAEHAALADGTTQFYEMVGRTPGANTYELDFAKALITGEKLGQNGVTDELVISLSPNDIQGHQFGPDSDFEDQMILSLDQQLDSFNSWLDQTVGLNNVWMALTADHGIAPVPGEAAKLGMRGVAVKIDKMYAKVNDGLNKQFNKGPEKLQFLLPAVDLPYMALDQRTFKALGIDEKTAEEAVAELLPDAVAAQDANPLPMTKLLPPTVVQPSQTRLEPGPRVKYVYTRLQLANGQLPPSEWGKLIAHSYVSHGNWFVMIVLDPFQLDGTGQFAGTDHFSPWSYDRHVPLAFYGAPFKPGEYHELVEPTDLAVTFASLAGVNRPSAAVGRVLTEAIKPSATAIQP